MNKDRRNLNLGTLCFDSIEEYFSTLDGDKTLSFITNFYRIYEDNIKILARTYDYLYYPTKDNINFNLNAGIRYKPDMDINTDKTIKDLDRTNIKTIIESILYKNQKMFQPIYAILLGDQVQLFDGIHRFLAILDIKNKYKDNNIKSLIVLLNNKADKQYTDIVIPEFIYSNKNIINTLLLYNGGDIISKETIDIDGLLYTQVSIKGKYLLMSILICITLVIDMCYSLHKHNNFYMEPLKLIEDERYLTDEIF